jgi:hypothetical protein
MDFDYQPNSSFLRLYTLILYYFKLLKIFKIWKFMGCSVIFIDHRAECMLWPSLAYL